MNRQDFDTLVVDRRIEQIRTVLQRKGKEYAPGDRDVFHNFKNSTGLSFHKVPEKVAWEFMVKHLRSIKDILDEMECGDCYAGHPTIEMIEEKFGDSINYLILMEGMLKERAIEYKNKPDTTIVNG